MSKLILNEELPSDLRKHLTQEARSEDLSVNDAATRILSARFDVPWTRSRSKFRKTADRFKLSVSEELHRRIRVEAAMKAQTIRGVTLSTLADHYGTKKIDPRRRPRKETQ